MVALNPQSVLAKLVNVDSGNMPPDLAREVLSWQFPQDDQHHLSDLLSKNNAGTLSPAERQELDFYLLLGDLVTTMQLKARLSLAAPAQPAATH